MKRLQREASITQSATCQDAHCLFRQIGALAKALGERHAEDHPGHEVVISRHETLRLTLVEMEPAR